MTTTRFRDSARYWRTPLMPGADLLTAEYHDHTFTPHWHDAYTIPVIEAGAETYQYRGSRYVAEAGSVPVINPGELHTGSRAMEEGWRYRVLYAPIDYLRQLAEDIAGRAQPLPWFDAEVIRDLDLAQRLSHAHRLLEANSDALAAHAAMLDALSTLLVRYGRTRPDAPQAAIGDKRVSTMQELLRSALAEPVTLAELADAVALSPFHAARLFTRATGLAPHAWRNQVRLQRSLAPLRAGVPVTEVAAASGFTDQSHFTRHFRRMFGVPPGRWQGA
ncbi:AraC family transcriptional regulator [Paraburkholderia sp. SARCC-3016]|uniref:AraC family transcriptional regulator n=1 Tax=Paraburkholderia sp. SARCC-3016 TaxID=3058611 RepID=UPI0028080E3D|nr:AraC family transcriptional regulator [Paraburkholderia sp. SARCC-3016]MDQ7981832.1 AraC family transcriptional regulator [Paraburkholderia sp. SARCC-3016]